MARPDDLPHIPEPATWLLAAMLGVAWVLARVRILRRRDTHRNEGEGPTPAWGWLRALADTKASVPALVAVLVLLGAAVLTVLLA